MLIPPGLEMLREENKCSLMIWFFFTFNEIRFFKKIKKYNIVHILKNKKIVISLKLKLKIYEFNKNYNILQLKTVPIVCGAPTYNLRSSRGYLL